MIMYSKLYMEVAMKKDKNIMIRVSKEAHTAFKKKAAEDGTTMSRIVRELVGRYLSGELELVESG
jgi:predicted DNA binding CopG/RHH family protein